MWRVDFPLVAERQPTESLAGRFGALMMGLCDCLADARACCCLIHFEVPFVSVFVCLDVLNMGIYRPFDKRDFLLLQLSCIKLNYVR